MGGSSTPKQKTSQSEIAQAQQAIAKHNERIDDGFAALEARMVDEARSEDFSNFLGGRSSADVAATEKDAYQAKTATPGAMSLRDFSSTGDAVASGVRQSEVDAVVSNESLRDTNRLGAAKVGQDVSELTAASLKSAARRGSDTAAQKVQNDILKSNARTQAVLTVANGALQGATLRADGYRFSKGGLQKGTVGKDGVWTADPNSTKLSPLRTAGLILSSGG